MVLGQGRKGRQATESHMYVTYSIRFVQIICAFKVDRALEKKEMLFWELGSNKANRFVSLCGLYIKFPALLRGQILSW